MKRIYAFAIGLALLGAPLADLGIAAADPGTRAMDYQQAADVVVTRGLAQKGVPFSWAGGGISGPSLGKGTGAAITGFDASGLMQYAYAGVGIKLPRSSGEIYRLGTKIPSQQAQKGDMLFYGPEGTQTVTMYLGNSQMLEVGDVVQVSAVRAADLTPYAVRVLSASMQAPLQQVPGQQQAPLPGQLQQAPGQTFLPQQQVPLKQVPAQQVPGQVPGQVPAQQAPLQQQFLQLPAQPAPAQVPTLQAPGQVPTH